MLEGLRAVQNTWIGKSILAVIMGFIVVSFAIWGIGDIFRGIGSNQVAQVGSVAISTNAYRQAYQTELQNLQQRARRPITNEEARRFGLDSQVLSRMISDAVLDDEAQSLGLAISDAQVAKAIRSDPTFAGPGGSFERGRFDAVLRDNGFNEQSFVREQRHVYLRQELVQAIVGEMVVPSASLEALHRFQAETRSLDYLVLPASAVGPIPVPDETTLQSYFDAHAQSFNAPQYRKLVVLSLSSSALAKPDDVSDADAQKLYDQVKEQRFGAAERRTVQQIVFPTEEEAAAASARIKAGAHFSDLLSERKLESKDVELGTVTKSQLFDRAVADAAFSLPQDGTSGPIKGAFGPVLVHVATIEPASVKPFGEVSAALKKEVATQRASVTLRDLHDKIEDARSSGKTLTEAAKSLGLDTLTIDAVDASGLDKGGKPVEGLADRDALLHAAFASDVGVDNDTVQGRDGSQTWFEVAAVEPAHPRTLAEVKPQVASVWANEETAKRLADKAADLVKALDGGQTLEQTAASLGNLPITHEGSAKRAGAPGLSNEVVMKVFDVPVGAAGSAAKGDDARVLFKVLDSIVPPLDPQAPEAVQMADRYRTSLSEDVLGTYLAKVGSRLGAKVNQEALRNAVGASL